MKILKITLAVLFGIIFVLSGLGILISILILFWVTKDDIPALLSILFILFSGNRIDIYFVFKVYLNIFVSSYKKRLKNKECT